MFTCSPQDKIIVEFIKMTPFKSVRKLYLNFWLQLSNIYSSFHDSSEIILICWFIINAGNSCPAHYYYYFLFGPCHCDLRIRWIKQYYITYLNNTYLKYKSSITIYTSIQKIDTHTHIYIYIYIYTISQKWVHPSHFGNQFSISFQGTIL